MKTKIIGLLFIICTWNPNYPMKKNILPLQELCLLALTSSSLTNKFSFNPVIYQSAFNNTTSKRIVDIIKEAKLARELKIPTNVESLERELTHANMQFSTSPTEKIFIFAYFQSLPLNDQTRIQGYQHSPKMRKLS